jgi:hypothetical protein
MNDQPLHLANMDFNLLKFHPLEFFSPGYPISFIDHPRKLELGKE